MQTNGSVMATWTVRANYPRPRPGEISTYDGGRRKQYVIRGITDEPTADRRAKALVESGPYASAYVERID